MKQRKEPFKLKLSVSTKTAKSKKEAGKITSFTVRDIPVSTGYLSDFFRTYPHSPNLWEKQVGNLSGLSKKVHYSGVTGVAIDIDGALGIGDGKERVKDVHHIIYTSTHHQVPKGDLPATDRYRIILPFHPDEYNNYPTENLHSWLYEKVKALYPELDDSCTSTHSKFYPSYGAKELFEVIIHQGKEYWSPSMVFDTINLSNMERNPTFSMNEIVLDENKKPIVVRDIKYDAAKNNTKVIFCPFCDPLDRGNPDQHNASIQLKNGVPSIYCASCEDRKKGLGKKGVYLLGNDEAFRIQIKNLGVVVFRDMITDKYYIGEHSKSQNRYMFNTITKMNIGNALKRRNMVYPEIFPEAEFTHDFSSDEIVNIDREFVNRYIVPDVLRMTAQPGVGKSIPKYIGLLTLHICGNDKDVYDLLINHLAYMVQKRVKTRVAFLFQGTQGTGKGVWFNYVLAPIFGRDYCADVLQKVFVKEFNTFLESNFCILVDEVEANFSETNNEITRVLKQVIADTHISVEGKGVDIRNGRNNANIFFATNKRNGVHIEPGDRRFIVAPSQENKIYDMPWWGDDDKMIELLKSETEEFVAYLKGYAVDYTKVNRPFDNPAKEALIDLSKTNADYFFEAIKDGNWDWLNENIVPDAVSFGVTSSVQSTLNRIKQFDKVSRDDLNDIYNNIHGKSLNPASFTHLCKLHGLEIKQRWIDGANKKGIKVKWDLKDLTEDDSSTS